MQLFQELPAEGLNLPLKAGCPGPAICSVFNSVLVAKDLPVTMFSNRAALPGGLRGHRYHNVSMTLGRALRWALGLLPLLPSSRAEQVFTTHLRGGWERTNTCDWSQDPCLCRARRTVGQWRPLVEKTPLSIQVLRKGCLAAPGHHNHPFLL